MPHTNQNDGSGELQVSHSARPPIVLRVPPYTGTEPQPTSHDLSELYQ